MLLFRASRSHQYDTGCCTLSISYSDLLLSFIKKKKLCSIFCTPARYIIIQNKGSKKEQAHNTQYDEATIKAKRLYIKSILFRPVVIKLCVCLFLDPVSHNLQTHTRPFWILYNSQVVLQLWCFCFSIWIYYPK